MTVLVPFLRHGFDFMVRSRLRGVWFRGDRPASRSIWAANHHSWWDPFVAHTVLARAGLSGGLVMDDESLAQFTFLRQLGIVGTSEVRAALRLVQDNRVLVVYPEAELRPPGPAGPLSRGAAWLAVHGEARLLAVAVRIVVRGHEAPEAYVDVRPVDAQGDSVMGTERLQETLTAALSEMDKALATEAPREPLPGFREVVRGRRSWDERLARIPQRRHR
jgi:1-acyl-sn-glycerol-3-phosphate acyltransferase